MPRRQPLPTLWLFADERLGPELDAVLRRLPCGAGVVVLCHGAERRRELLKRIRRLARSRRLTLIDDVDGAVARIHNMRELTRARLARVPLVFISPVCPTRSHPERTPLPRMRAASLARLSRHPVFALGGMDARRFRSVGPLGFAGWGGIDAWLRKPSRE